jgi:hypothetical protein
MKKHTPIYLVVGLALAMLCIGCGEKQDYSGSGDLSKAQASPAAVPHPEKGAPTASPAEMMTPQKRPDGK